MGQSVTCMGALHPQKYPKVVFPIDKQQELQGYFQSQILLETMVTWYLNIAYKVRLGKCPIDQVSAEDLTGNSNKLVRGLRLPPQQGYKGLQGVTRGDWG